jgi:acyl phosphate:glycerol-3-phosphate acyltransferase
VGRIVAGKDVRKHGSGNIGASNVARVVGKFWGRFTLILDAAKGSLVVFLAQVSEISGDHVAWAGVAAVVGHCWSVFLRFRGGKGVATSAGVMAVLAPVAALISFVAWLVTYMATRKSSVASLSGATIMMILVGLYFPALLLPMSAIFAILLFRHRGNIKRILAGVEIDSKL